MTQVLVKGLLISILLVSIGFFFGQAIGFPIVGFLGVLVAIAGWLSPSWALLGLIAIAPLSRSPATQLFSPQLVVVTRALLAVLLGLVWWIKRRITPDPRALTPTWICAYLVAWSGLAILTTMNAQDWRECLPHLSVCLAGAILFLMVWHAEDSLDRKIAVVIVLSAAVVCCISLLQYAMLKFQILPAFWPYIMAPREQLHMALHPPETGFRIWRVSGTFMHSNALGTYLFLLMPFVFAWLSVVELVWPYRLVLAASLVLMCLALYATNSRGSILGSLISVGYLGLHRGHRWILSVGLLMVALAGAVYSTNPEGVATYLDNISRVEYKLSSRESIWPNVIDLLQRYPLLGVGPGNFPTQYESHFGFFVFDNPEEIVEEVWDVQLYREKLINSFHAHNTLLMVVGEYGLFGLPLLLIGVVTVLWKSERGARRLPAGSFGRSTALAAASFCVGYMVSSQFDSYVVFTEMGLLMLGTPLVAMGLRKI